MITRFTTDIKHWYILLAFLLATKTVYGLDTLVVSENSFQITGQYLILVDKGYDYAAAKTWLENAQQSNYKDPGRIWRSYNSYWVGIILSNETNATLNLISEAKFDSVWLNDFSQICCKNSLCKDPRKIIKQSKREVAYFDLPPGQHLFVAKISDFHLSNHFTPSVSDAKSFEGNLMVLFSPKIYLLSTLGGIFIILAIIGLLIFFKIKDWTFFWYAIFSFTLSFHFTRTLGQKYESYDLINRYVEWIYLKMMIFYLFYIAYMFFCLYLIDAKNKYPKEYQLGMKVTIILSLLLIPELLLLMLGWRPESYTYYFSVRFAANIFFFYLLVRMVKHKNDPFVIFVLIGGFCLLSADFVTSISLSKIAYNISVFGTFCDVILFSIALAYKIYDNNRRMTASLSDNLVNKNRILELNLEKTQLNMNLLQSQMNPHFIFNSLNSIKFHIINLENEKASYYLSRFSKLMRIVLEHSAKHSIFLKEELELLKIYLEMESLRFNDNFSFSINITDHLEMDMIKIPPHLIQPYVENAIIHAFTQMSSPSKLDINISEDDFNLIIEIVDNGIGRRAAALNKINSRGDKHKSKGLSITEERIKQFGVLNSKNTSIEVFDLWNENGTSAGTKVVIKL